MFGHRILPAVAALCIGTTSLADTSADLYDISEAVNVMMPKYLPGVDNRMWYVSLGEDGVYTGVLGSTNDEFIGVSADLLCRAIAIYGKTGYKGYVRLVVSTGGKKKDPQDYLCG
ncbi:hypothetical protein [Pseudooceanicola nanhaiensis]|uniref:hypothetical protein n=1 Tax=Pseudooceanicola nanhaiensis TaxID=375761 RepID=UPI0035117DFC